MSHDESSKELNKKSPLEHGLGGRNSLFTFSHLPWADFAEYR